VTVGQLLAEMHIQIFFYEDLKPCRKVGQVDLLFGFWSGFISTSVHARLQVSVCSVYDLFHPG